MKRYLLFAGDKYYPMGGMNDFVKDFDTITELEAATKGYSNDSFEWFHAYDTKTKNKFNPKTTTK